MRGDGLAAKAGELAGHLSHGEQRRLQDIQPFRPSFNWDWIYTLPAALWGSDTRDYYDRITFSPGYERGDAPFGTWEAEELWVPEQYLEANTRWLE